MRYPPEYYYYFPELALLITSAALILAALILAAVDGHLVTGRHAGNVHTGKKRSLGRVVARRGHTQQMVLSLIPELKGFKLKGHNS